MKRSNSALLCCALLSIATIVGGCRTSSVTDVAPSDLTPDQALDRLMKGNERFASGHPRHPNQGAARRGEVADGQHPYAIVLACADSRVGPEVVFDQGVGDVFVVRVAGNIADETGVASMEFATAVLGAEVIVVMGHTECGAVKATIDTVTAGQTLPGHLPALATAIRPAVTSLPAGGVSLDAATESNVRHVVNQLRTTQPILADLNSKGKIKVVGGVYDLHSGRFRLIETP